MRIIRRIAKAMWDVIVVLFVLAIVGFAAFGIIQASSWIANQYRNEATRPWLEQLQNDNPQK